MSKFSLVVLALSCFLGAISAASYSSIDQYGTPINAGCPNSGIKSWEFVQQDLCINITGQSAYYSILNGIATENVWNTSTGCPGPSTFNNSLSVGLCTSDPDGGSVRVTSPVINLSILPNLGDTPLFATSRTLYFGGCNPTTRADFPYRVVTNPNYCHVQTTSSYRVMCNNTYAAFSRNFANTGCTGAYVDTVPLSVTPGWCDTNTTAIWECLPFNGQAGTTGATGSAATSTTGAAGGGSTTNTPAGSTTNTPASGSTTNQTSTGATATTGGAGPAATGATSTTSSAVVNVFSPIAIFVLAAIALLF